MATFIYQTANPVATCLEKHHKGNVTLFCLHWVLQRKGDQWRMWKKDAMMTIGSIEAYLCPVLGGGGFYSFWRPSMLRWGWVAKGVKWRLVLLSKVQADFHFNPVLPEGAKDGEIRQKAAKNWLCRPCKMKFIEYNGKIYLFCDFHTRKQASLWLCAECTRDWL